MNVILKIFLVTVASYMLALPSLAAGTTQAKLDYSNIDPADVQQKVLKTEALALKRLEFEVFAKTKVKQLNRNHKFSRTRMEVTKKSDGTYSARYHQIDDSTMSVKVRRSKSGTIPYVGVITYKEQVFESSARTQEELGQGSFAVVKVIPNRHIFSYQKGVWK
jgi:hypothetical protein